MKEYSYKGFTLKRNGYPATPWNIYNTNGVWVGFGKTMADCKTTINDGCYDEDKNRRY